MAPEIKQKFLALINPTVSQEIVQLKKKNSDLWRWDTLEDVFFD